jgi:hypothetical protein
MATVFAVASSVTLIGWIPELILEIYGKIV